MIRLDTLDRKPKLYDLLAAAVAVAVVSAVLLAKDGSRYSLAAAALQAAFFAYVLIRLITAFFRQVRYNLYSYNTIYYFGFAVFDVFVLIEYAVIIINMIKMPGVYGSYQVLGLILGSAEDFMFLSSPFLIVFSVALVISNLSLLKHEGRSFVNLLGIILSALLIGGEVFLFAYDFYATGSQFEVMLHDIFADVFAAVFLYYECMILGIMVAGSMAAKYEPDKDKDYMIILGCGLMKDGTPTPLLKGRADRALEFAKMQKEESGKDITFVCSGGRGQDEPISESLAIKNYLLSKGIDEEKIIEEDKSRDTFENMGFSKEKIMAENPDAKIAFSTTNYHVFRSGLYARRHKMRAQGIGAKTKWYFWPNAAVREFVGLLTAHKLKQLLILGSFIIIYVVLTLIKYTLY